MPFSSEEGGVENIRIKRTFLLCLASSLLQLNDGPPPADPLTFNNVLSGRRKSLPDSLAPCAMDVRPVYIKVCTSTAVPPFR